MLTRQESKMREAREGSINTYAVNVFPTKRSSPKAIKRAPPMLVDNTRARYCAETIYPIETK